MHSQGEHDRPFERLALHTMEPTSFGHGFISGIISAILGITAFGLVLALRYPQLFGFAELRPVRSFAYLQGLLQLALVMSFLLGAVSAWLRTNKVLALTGIAFTLAASALGGAGALGGAAASDIGNRAPGRSWLGIDFFVLNLLLYSGAFVPLERLFALRAEQPVFRRDWPLDLTYFFLNSLLIEVLTILTLRPVVVLFEWARVDAMTSLTLIVQVPMLLLVADFTQYWVHRAFHASRWLWPCHAIHHSIEQMDWLAGSRLHLIDVIVTRGVTYLPIFLLGFSERALMVYVFIVAVQATFIHANVRWTLPRWQRVVATPAFHHWHHSAEPQSIDKNFAVHTPVWDLLFGTYYLPDRWPAAYGLVHHRDVPSGWLRQLAYPVRKAVLGTGMMRRDATIAAAQRNTLKCANSEVRAHAEDRT